MNINIENMNDGQINRIEALIADIRKENARKPLAWKPEEGEVYEALGIGGSIYIGNYYEDRQECRMDYKTANCFHSGSSHFEMFRREIIREIEELVDKYDSERGGAFVVGVQNYWFGYNASDDSIVMMSNFSAYYNGNLPVFSSEEIAQRILDEVGEDRVKLLFTKYPIVRGDE